MTRTPISSANEAILKPKVLTMNNPSYVEKEYLGRLQELVEFHVLEQDGHEATAQKIKDAVEKNGSFVAFLVFMEWKHKERPFPLNENLVGSLVDSGCDLIACGGAGFDWADIPYLTSHGVYYANTPDSAAVRTADSTAMMILQALSGSSEREADARAGRWLNFDKLAKDVRRSTVGIIGMGNIGKLVAQHMHHFGMKIIYYNRSRLPSSDEEQFGKAEYVSFEEILVRSDVLTIHTPLNESTRHLLNRSTFARMRDGIIIVNTSRGPVIEEDALVEALESGKVLRAALDVYEFEPKIHPGLIKALNTTLLPHSAVANATILQDQQTEVLANLEAFLKTGKPNSPVNTPVSRGEESSAGRCHIA
ncbi:D-isomer specific 2-hydroxyacid dehydrogenase [Lentinula aciculospora]|uniref:D-isomer specific 2-hydroxyacid dehydrogenase n=1 Tax=Lentinula aciculospora TaxID=153920 RepID=A0A9W9AHF9_9AGAR|nr:D-isomer specific 2-hydroxyacid dehydrogenase [Lentinula aciculospora]